MENFIYLLPIFGFLFSITIIIVIIVAITKKRNKPVTMEQFAKNPFGNLFSVAFDSIAQGSRLDSAFQAVISNPCQATADNLLGVLNGVGDVFKFGMSNGNGVNTALWKNTFNSYIIPCQDIREDTKMQIREALIRLSVDHLYEVRKKMDVQAIGDAGEENVWFTLTQLASRKQFNVFSSVRLPYQSINQSSQEIDAVIVSPKGVFLIEVKSVSRDSDTVIKFYDISNPSQQICLHEEAFIQNFGEISHKNLLVVSYPNTERAKVDISTFPNTPTYSSLTVDDLYERIISFEGPDVLDDATIAAISKKLTTCINYKDGVPVTKWIINGVENKNSQPAAAVRFCSNCGNKIEITSSFCANCGNKL